MLREEPYLGSGIGTEASGKLLGQYTILGANSVGCRLLVWRFVEMRTMGSPGFRTGLC